MAVAINSQQWAITVNRWNVSELFSWHSNRSKVTFREFSFSHFPARLEEARKIPNTFRQIKLYRKAMNGFKEVLFLIKSERLNTSDSCQSRILLFFCVARQQLKSQADRNFHRWKFHFIHRGYPTELVFCFHLISRDATVQLFLELIAEFSDFVYY